MRDLGDSIGKIFSDAKKYGEPIHAVIHFAGLKSASESIRNPLYWKNNTSSTINLLDVMNKNNCRNIIFSSSAAVYGETDNHLINEDDPINPISPYGNSKRAIEIILRDLYKSSSDEWSVGNLRYFNPIGAHESGLVGECPSTNFTNIFPIILQVANRELTKINIYGNDWNTKDGTAERDYIHIMDLVDGHLLALEYLFANKGKFINLNLGTGVGTSVGIN